MKTKILFVLFILAAFAFGQLDRSTPPKPGPAPQIKIGEYQSFTLANGLKVFVVTNSKLPLVTYSLTLDVDPVLEKDKAGYVDMAGRLMRTGTKTRTKEQLDNEIDLIGASLGTSAASVYGSSLKKHMDKMLTLMSDVLLNAEFRDAELEKIRKQTISNLVSSKDEPDEIAERVKQRLYFGEGHPYAEFETEATVKKITKEDCESYYKTFFRPNIAYLSIVGDITLDEAKAAADKYFGKWEKADVPKNSYKQPKAPLLTKVAVVDRDNSVQTTINIGYPVDLSLNTPDVITARVMNTILGGGAFRLFENLREKHGYTYGAYSQLSPGQLVGSFTASADVRNEVTDSAVTEFLYEMKRIRNEAVSEKELQKAKNFITGSFAISMENPQTVASFAVNTAKYNLPKDFYANYLLKVNSLTADDIQAAAKKYILPEKSYIILVGKSSGLTPLVKKFSSMKIEYYDEFAGPVDPNAKAMPEGVSAQAVIDKYIAAIGGKDNLVKVTDRTTAMTAQVQGYDITATLYQKAPNKMMQKLSFSGMEQVILFDGQKGKSKSPMGEEEMEGESLEQVAFESDMLGIMRLEESGIKTVLAGIEKIDEKDAYKIEFTLKSGGKLYHFFDAETGLKVREQRTVNSPQGTFTQTTSLSDYREVAGVKYPYKLVQSVAGMVIEMNVSSVEVNKGLSDEFFK